MSETKHKVFVYGTLRPATKGDGTDTVKVRGTLYSLGWYPGVVLGGEGEVTCEVIEVTNEELKVLDLYEGYYPNDPDGSLYLRTSVMINGETGWIYVYNGSITGKEVILSGDWRKKETVDVP